MSLTAWRRPCETLLVLDCLIRDSEKWLEKALSGRNSDGSDLSGNGFCVDKDGYLDDCYFYNHDDLVYFRDKLSGKQRLLQYVSWYLRGEINLVLLMRMQCRVMAGQVLENLDVRDSWSYPEKNIIVAGEADHEERPTIEIEIESRESIELRAKEPFILPCRLISIADANDDFAALENEPIPILQLKFDDADESDELCEKRNMMTDEQAKEIAEFIKSAGKRDTLICQCEYGQSRSAAIAAAARQYFYGDGIDIFTDERYYPNRFVYRKVLDALTGSE